jgi:hypothetical protein
LKLIWQSARDPRKFQGYQITRADHAVGRFEKVGETELTEFVDTQAKQASAIITAFRLWMPMATSGPLPQSWHQHLL